METVNVDRSSNPRAVGWVAIPVTETTVPKQFEPFAWKPGQSGNPAGRPKGARHKLGEAFIEALHVSFQEQGADAIQRVIDDKPEQYLKVIASLLPKDINLNITDEIELTDDQLVQRMRDLTAAVAPFLDRAANAGAGDGEAASAEATARLH